MTPLCYCLLTSFIQKANCLWQLSPVSFLLPDILSTFTSAISLVTMFIHPFHLCLSVFLPVCLYGCLFCLSPPPPQARALAHSRTHSRTRTRTHTHTHTHTLSLSHSLTHSLTHLLAGTMTLQRIELVH